MPKTTPLQAWVKNVYSLCVKGVQTRVYLYTAPYKKHTNLVYRWVKPHTFTHSIHRASPHLYTPHFSLLTDINLPLSTVSTAPIIKKNK